MKKDTDQDRDREDFKFEKAIEKLEKIVEFLESGDATLDEALKKYEEGVKLSRQCGQKLAEAEKKIEILTRSLNGSLIAEPFQPEGIDREETKSPAEAKRGKKSPPRTDHFGDAEVPF